MSELHSLPGRESELAQVMKCLEEAIYNRKGRCLYVSGVPGSGKTETVSRAIAHLKQTMTFRRLDLSGEKHNSAGKVYSRLWQVLGRKSSSDSLVRPLNQLFNGKRSTRQMGVVVVDEIDILLEKSPSVIYNLFDWSSRVNSTLVVVAISNTMDLPERILSNKASSRLGLKRIDFQPYSHIQLLAIVKNLFASDRFDEKAMELCARRVGAISGDARRLISICNRLLESCPNVPITIDIVDSMFRQLHNLGDLSVLPLYQQLLVYSLARLVQDSEQRTSLHRLVDECWQTCKIRGLIPPSLSEMRTMLLQLSSRYVLLESNILGMHSWIQPGQIDIDPDVLVQTGLARH